MEDGPSSSTFVLIDQKRNLGNRAKPISKFPDFRSRTDSQSLSDGGKLMLVYERQKPF